jgi:hypothetical protein
MAPLPLGNLFQCDQGDLSVISPPTGASACIHSSVTGRTCHSALRRSKRHFVKDRRDICSSGEDACCTNTICYLWFIRYRCWLPRIKSPGHDL